MGRNQGSGAGRAPSGPRLGTRFEGPESLASALDATGGSGFSETRVETQMKLLEKGVTGVVKISVSPQGKQSIDDGRHRIEAQRRLAAQGKVVKLKVVRTRGSKALDK